MSPTFREHKDSRGSPAGFSLYRLENVSYDERSRESSETAEAPVVEEAQFRHADEVAAVTGQTPARDAVLLCVLYGTGMTATELAQLEVADVLSETGEFRRESEVRAAIAVNGRCRPIFGTNPRVTEALDAYFVDRVRLGHAVTAWRSQWRARCGVDQRS